MAPDTSIEAFVACDAVILCHVFGYIAMVLWSVLGDTLQK